MKLISFSEILLLTLNEVGGKGGNSSSDSLQQQFPFPRGITPQALGPNPTDHFCPLLQGMQRALGRAGPYWLAANPKLLP